MSPRVKMQDSLLRLTAATWFGGTEALADVLCRLAPDGSGFLTAPKKLHIFLLKFYDRKNEKLGKAALFEDQIERLFPDSRETDIKSLDISLLATVIFNCTNCPRNRTLVFDIRSFPPPGNVGTGDYVHFMQQLRNEVAHWGLRPMSSDEFEEYWRALEITLNGLGFDVTKVRPFKAGPIPEDGPFVAGALLYQIDVMRDFCHNVQGAQSLLENQLSVVAGSASEASLSLVTDEMSTLKLYTEASASRIQNRVDELFQEKLAGSEEGEEEEESEEEEEEEAGATANGDDETTDEAGAANEEDGGVALAAALATMNHNMQMNMLLGMQMNQHAMIHQDIRDRLKSSQKFYDKIGLGR